MIGATLAAGLLAAAYTLVVALVADARTWDRPGTYPYLALAVGSAVALILFGARGVRGPAPLVPAGMFLGLFLAPSTGLVAGTAAATLAVSGSAHGRTLLSLGVLFLSSLAGYVLQGLLARLR